MQLRGKLSNFTRSSLKVAALAVVAVAALAVVAVAALAVTAVK